MVKKGISILYNVKDKQVIAVLTEIPRGQRTQFITNCILEQIKRIEWKRKRKSQAKKHGMKNQPPRLKLIQIPVRNKEVDK